MNIIKDLTANAGYIEKKLHYCFKNKDLLVLAFIHRSYINEHRDVTEHNERLEFLGDSILGLLISDYLYRQLPGFPEGDLSSIRAKLVEAATCVTYIQKLDVGQFLLLGKGERMNGGKGRDSILADLFEALVGAIYLDGGFEAAREFFFTNFSFYVESTLQQPVKNSKAILQNLCQKKFQQAPFYKVLSESGPDHNKNFQIVVMINDKEIGYGQGASKKEAQQAAASEALLKNLNNIDK